MILQHQLNGIILQQEKLKGLISGVTSEGIKFNVTLDNTAKLFPMQH